jgi:hypothetical protein
MMIWTDIYHSYETEKEVVEKGEGEEPEERTIYIPKAGPVSYISVDFQKDKVDLAAVGRYLASRCAVLGSQTFMSPAPAADDLLTMWQSEPGVLEEFISWLGEDYRACDPDELDEKLRGECSMLLPEERVQMGFVCGRDTMVFTSHRAMQIDKQFLGQKVLYLSLPWTKIKKYEVESAGTWDLDACVALSIKAPWYNRELGRGLSIDFAKGRCDILALNAYISAQVVGAADGTSTVAREVLPEQPEGLISEFFSWLGDDFHQISAEDAAAKFSSDPPILMGDEAVEIAFKCGRDFWMATTKRWIKVDVQSKRGSSDSSKVLYESMPLSSVPCFSVTTAASNPFDQDAEIGLLTRVGEWGFDVKKGQGDIMAIYTLMNQKCVLDRLQGRAIAYL